MQGLLTLLNPAHARQHYLSGAWKPDSFYTLLRQHARDRSDAPAVRDVYRRWSWRELLERVEVLAQDMHDQGLQAGARVLVWLPDRAEQLVVMLACSRNGYVCCASLSAQHDARDAVSLMTRLRCAALVAMPGHGTTRLASAVFDAARAMSHLRVIYVVQPGRPVQVDSTGLRAFPLEGSIDALRASEPSLDPDKVIHIDARRAVTGDWLGVMHSDNTLLCNGRSLVNQWPGSRDTAVRVLDALHTPLGLLGIEYMMVSGAEMIIDDRGVRGPALDRLLAAPLGCLIASGQAVRALLDEIDVRGLSRLGSVRQCYVANGGDVSDVAPRLWALGVTPLSLHGVPETGMHGQGAWAEPDGIAHRCTVWQGGATDQPCALGEVGELGFKGGALMLGYFDDQGATQDAFNASGWLLPGLRARRDAQGTLHPVDADRPRLPVGV